MKGWLITSMCRSIAEWSAGADREARKASDDSNAPSDAAPAPIPTKRIIAGRSGPPYGAQGSGEDRLLLSLSGLEVPTCRRIPRQGYRSLGHEEIQTLARSQVSGVRLAWPCEAESAGAVRALVRPRFVLAWSNGSPVSREIHAGFCDLPRGQLPRLTCAPFPFRGLSHFWLGLLDGIEPHTRW